MQQQNGFEVGKKYRNKRTGKVAVVTGHGADGRIHFQSTHNIKTNWPGGSYMKFYLTPQQCVNYEEVKE